MTPFVLFLGWLWCGCVSFGWLLGGKPTAGEILLAFVLGPFDVAITVGLSLRRCADSVIDFLDRK